MTDLESLRVEAPPRDDALSARLARRFVPWWVFLGYGVIWFFVAALFTIVLTAGSAMLLMHVNASRSVAVIPNVVMAVSFVLAWVPFGVWVSRRRARARPIFRSGVLAMATVADVVTRSAVKGGRWTSVRLDYALGGVERHAAIETNEGELVEGASIAVLVAPDGKGCIAFRGDGSMILPRYGH